ncbi:hypothetical protein TIFTF001_024384 [Ficus carica]|uniref:PGG domain-containing protein n=1 Tax=Ficus carica TaxID=3494 RepID=A0AA88AHW5_FICCA|nr:hypothetical protein TIFTF001_024384 [Ficus carica]
MDDIRSEVDNKLYKMISEGQWEEIVTIYKQSRDVQTTEFTKSGDTLLHLAVFEGETKAAIEMVETISNSDNMILEYENATGDTALHIAAAMGNWIVCRSMILTNRRIINHRNRNGETPIFLAAFHGKRFTFLFLRRFLDHDYNLLRRQDGNTVLHAAIMGEQFRLAMDIILHYPDSANYKNVDGFTPLHILASKPNVFPSSCRLGLFRRLIYRYFVENDFEVETDQAVAESFRPSTEILKYPKNYETSMNLFTMLSFCLKSVLRAPLMTTGGETTDVENPQQDQETRDIEDEINRVDSGWKLNRIRRRHFPCDSFLLFISIMIKALLFVLGKGKIWKNLQRMKLLHMEVKHVLTELVKLDKTYESFGNKRGLEPATNIESPFPEDILGSEKVPEYGYRDFVRTQTRTRDAAWSGMTPILIAAKRGVIEIVEEILKEFPVAIRDVDYENKNVVLLAVESRQRDICTFLFGSNRIVPESAFRQLDREGNSILHLAAVLRVFEGGDLIHIQQELEFFQFVKDSMQPHFLPQYNKRNETPEDIFNQTHKELAREASNQLYIISESSSVVATVVASVAFATSTTVPGGNDQETGTAVLRDKPAFDAFAISSLFALCSSVTALVFFLSVLAARHRFEDFIVSLPWKLLLAFMALFTSIASMLISFFSGQTFVLRDELKPIAYPLYGALCLPLALFALAQLPLYFDLIWVILRKAGSIKA